MAKEEEVASVTPKVEVLSQLHRMKKGGSDKSARDKVKFGDKLTREQHKEIEKLIDQYEHVFYDGGESPLVRVGIEHNILIYV